MASTYENYLETPKSLTFDQMKTICIRNYLRKSKMIQLVRNCMMN